MDIFESARGEHRRFIGAAVLVLMVGILAPPAVSAAAKAITVKKVKQPVKVADTTGDKIDSQAIPPLGTSQAPGSEGALAVRTFAGGGGLLGLGECTPAPAPGPSLTIGANPQRKVTALIITSDGSGTGTVSVAAPAVLPNPLTVADFTVNASNPNELIALGNGLTVTPSDLVFTCSGAGNVKFAVLGQ